MFKLVLKKKYILIYAYANFSNEELNYWNALSKRLKKEKYTLIILAPLLPKKKYNFICYIFKEKLDNVKIRQDIKNDLPDNYYKIFLEREKTWYGKSSKNRLLAAKTQRTNYIDLLSETNPCLVLMANANHAGELIFKKEIEKRNIPLLFFERGCLNKTWHIDEQGITANTKIALKNYSDIEELKSIDISLYNNFKSHYFKEKETWWSQPKTSKKLNIREKYNLLGEQKIILFLNQLDNDTSNFLFSPFFKSNLEAFRWFLSKLPDQDLFVIAKKHPWFSGDKYDFINAFSEFNIKGVWIEDIQLFECFKQSDYVCAVNSTAIFEALIFDKPVLQLGKSILSNKEIVYEQKKLNDLEALNIWLRKDDFEYRIMKYKKFISYLIKYELSFFSKTCIEMGFNGPEFMFDKIMSKIEKDRYGKISLSYVHKYQFFNEIIIRPKLNLLKRIARLLYKKII